MLDVFDPAPTLAPGMLQRGEVCLERRERWRATCCLPHCGRPVVRILRADLVIALLAAFWPVPTLGQQVALFEEPDPPHARSPRGSIKEEKTGPTRVVYAFDKTEDASRGSFNAFVLSGKSGLSSSEYEGLQKSCA